MEWKLPLHSYNFLSNSFMYSLGIWYMFWTAFINCLVNESCLFFFVILFWVFILFQFWWCWFGCVLFGFAARQMRKSLWINYAPPFIGYYTSKTPSLLIEMIVNWLISWMFWKVFKDNFNGHVVTIRFQIIYFPHFFHFFFPLNIFLIIDFLCSKSSESTTVTSIYRPSIKSKRIKFFPKGDIFPNWNQK